jgi:DNA-nicking Smr family endonuclease
MVMKKQNSDNTDLWMKIAKTVAPIKSDKISPINILDNHSQKVSLKPVAKSVKSNILPQKQISPNYLNSKSNKHTPSDLRYEEASGMDGASSKKLRAGKFDVEATLDLHGMTQQRAYLSLQRFIQKSVLNQFRTILVITGKGSEGRGVLRNQFPEWLKTDACAQHILAFGQAQAKDGGSGAFYIRLRRNRGARK